MNEIDKEVFNQSWEHYRHLENIRQKTTTFYYTLIATLVTGLGFLANFKDSATTDQIATIAVFASNIVVLYGVFAYFAVIKLQAARSAHGFLIQNILARAYGEDFSQHYDTPFRRQLDSSTPALLRKGLVRFLLRRPAQGRRELLFSQTPMFIFLPMLLMSGLVLVYVVYLAAPAVQVHRVARAIAVVIDVVCTLYVCLALVSPQDSWPDLGETTRPPAA